MTRYKFYFGYKLCKNSNISNIKSLLQVQCGIVHDIKTL